MAGPPEPLVHTAYRVALVTDVYGHSPHLDRLVADVQQIEAQLADDITRRLLGADGELPNDVLNRRLEMLRQCARELAGLATTPTSAPSD